MCKLCTLLRIKAEILMLSPDAFIPNEKAIVTEIDKAIRALKKNPSAIDWGLRLEQEILSNMEG